MEPVSVLLTAYNEGQGIGRVLNYLEENSDLINDVVIVSDACKDETEDIIVKWIEGGLQFPVATFFNTERQGRANAIRQGLEATQMNITVIFACDIKPLGNSFQNILAYFQDPNVGAVTGHPTLTNGTSTIADCLCHVMWQSHDNIGELTTSEGKFFHLNGEMFAIRNSTLKNFGDYNGIAEDAMIGHCIYKKGYKVLWARDVTYLMQYPSSLEEWIKIRKRCCYGRIELAHKAGIKDYPFYEIKHWEYISNIINVCLSNWKFMLVLPIGALLEMACRLYYFIMYHYISQDREKLLLKLWQPSEETKW